jgi:hypothetical protein
MGYCAHSFSNPSIFKPLNKSLLPLKYSFKVLHNNDLPKRRGLDKKT